MKAEQIDALRQLARGQRRPAGDDERVVSRVCGGLVNRKLAERVGSCHSRNDPTALVAEYQITKLGLDYLETHDAVLPTDLVDGEGPPYIQETIRRLAAGTADTSDAENVVSRAANLGLEIVRLTVARASDVRSGRGGTLKQLGRDGPRSSEDVTPTQVDDAMWTAAWRVCDIKLWLRSPAADRLRAVPARACAG